MEGGIVGADLPLFLLLTILGDKLLQWDYYWSLCMMLCNKMRLGEVIFCSRSSLSWAYTNLNTIKCDLDWFSTAQHFSKLGKEGQCMLLHVFTYNRYFLFIIQLSFLWLIRKKEITNWYKTKGILSLISLLSKIRLKDSHSTT